jgi:hypothetical protein
MHRLHKIYSEKLNMLESTVEEKLRKGVKVKGGIAYKFVSPGRRHVPDRLLLYPIAPEHIEIVAQYVQFVELKAPKKKPNAGQIREHRRLRKMGFKVEVVDR